MSTVVLFVRIRRELKEQIEKYGINVRDVVEKALEEEIKRIRRERLRKLIKEVLESTTLTVEEWIESVEEDRSR